MSRSVSFKNREQFLFDDAQENLVRVRDEKTLLEQKQGDLFIEEKWASQSQNIHG